MFKPQDVLVVIQLSADRRPWTVSSLSNSLLLPHATVQRSLERCRHIGFFSDSRERIDPYMAEEFLVGAVQFGFPPIWGPVCKGVPTAWSAEPLSSQLHVSPGDHVVWPTPDGRRKGRSLQPLHPVLPELSRSNKQVYRWVTLVDAVRAGRAREREIAADLIHALIDESLMAVAA